jgi:tetratricopeptide (TPR) repeat protein
VEKQGITDIINEGKRKALIISVSDYIDNKLQPLGFCRKDGEQMYEVLKSLDYEITDNRKLIGQVKFDTMRDAIYDFFDNSQTAANDTLLFYYSGHGIPISEGNMCLSSSETYYDSPKKRGFTSYELTNLIQESNSIRIVEILDCCYSGANKLTKGGDEEAAAKLGRDIIETNKKMLQQGEGKCILAASQAAQEAFGLKEKEHSIFTFYLLEGLRGHKNSVNADGTVTPSSLGKYVYNAILNLPPNKRPKQKPVTKTDASGEIILANYPYLARPEAEPIHTSPSSTDISFIIDKGLRYITSEEYDSAISSFNDAIAINPNNYVPHNYKGDILLKKGDYNGAIDAYEKAIAANPKNDYAYYCKGDAYFKLEDYKQAIVSYDEALKISPRKGKRSELSEYEYKRGVSLYDSGKYEEAIECLDKSLEANSKNTQTWYYKGLVLAHRSQYNEAISCYDEALKLNPTYSEATKAKESAIEEQRQKEISLLINEGLRYNKINDYQNAIDSFDKAIRLNPNYALAWYNKGVALNNLGKGKEAIKCYDKAIQINRNYALAWYNKGVALNNLGKGKEAIKCYDKGILCISRKLLDIESIIETRRGITPQVRNIYLFQINNKRRGISTRSS